MAGTDYEKLQQSTYLNSAAYHAAITLREARADVERVAKLMGFSTPQTWNGSDRLLGRANDQSRKLLKEALEGES